MQTHLADWLKGTPAGQEADAILRKCVHCGFCLATCPTYQLLGDELDSPRGRIYLIKQVAEGSAVSVKTQTHLDRCLTCRNCETTCPSGVQYGRLVDIGRNIVEQRVARGFGQRLLRWTLRVTLPRRWLFEPALRLGQLLRPLLPRALREKIPERQAERAWPVATHPRRMLILEGCVQPGLAPNINAAAARVLDKLGISLQRVAQAGCCGALSYHLNAQEDGMTYMRRNIDAWWPHIEAGIEAIVITASGCGAMVKEYGHVLWHDQRYAQKAERISSLARDIGEILAAAGERYPRLAQAQRLAGRKIAFHAPCTLQHAMKLTNLVEPLLRKAGAQLTYVRDAHLCCGSAGTYSILQPALARRLRDNKLAALHADDPDTIVSANIGCLTHLQSGAETPVRHWIELIDEAVAERPGA